ncbi:MAG: hypothetical protein KDC53_00310 [Saprospiraceae bacterium]|nr:hypothetical protein [Saprospiraceae bacterium]
MLFTNLHLGAQDLYSQNATRKFADFLFSKGDYAFASEEYARLLFMNADNDTLLIRLSKSYRKQEKFSLAASLFGQYRSSDDLGNAEVENEYLTTLLFQKDTNNLSQALQHVRYLSSDEVTRKKIEASLLSRNWKKTAVLIERLGADAKWVEPYKTTLAQASSFRPKKPWLAATYSAIIPGSGKMYAKNVKEGVTSLFFVSALGYQSYRAFRKRGSKAVSGWIYGGLSLGFYLGNIYGAHQSARNYNTRQLNSIYHEVDQYILDRN